MSKSITKIKTKEGAIEIRYAETIGKVEKEVIFKCSELAHPDLDLAMSALVRDVYTILDLPMDWAPARMKVTGVSFSMSEGTAVEGAVITGQVELETSNAPFCFNTPHLPFGQYSPTGTAPLMSPKAVEHLEKLKQEAQEYLDGKRAQLPLPLGK